MILHSFPSSCFIFACFYRYPPTPFGVLALRRAYTSFKIYTDPLLYPPLTGSNRRGVGWLLVPCSPVVPGPRPISLMNCIKKCFSASSLLTFLLTYVGNSSIFFSLSLDTQFPEEFLLKRAYRYFQIKIYHTLIFLLIGVHFRTS